MFVKFPVQLKLFHNLLLYNIFLIHHLKKTNMAPIVSTAKGIDLLDSIDASSLRKSPSSAQLTQLLERSETGMSGSARLRTESPVIIDKIKRQAGSLSSVISGRQAASPEYKVFRRETPVFSTRLPSSVPDWANGSKPAYSLGPFPGIDGRQFWFDFYRYEKLIPVYMSGIASPVMLLPLKISLLNASVNKFNLGDGSIWMRADLFTPGLNNTQYTGLNITGGELNFSAKHSITNNSITITSSESFTLKLKLNNIFSSTGSGIEGLDARESTITLPETADLIFAAGKFKLQQLASASWNLYGDARNFVKADAAPLFNGFINKLVFPLTTDQPDFSIKKTKSAFFHIRDKAKVISCGWCLSIGVLDVSKPFAVGNNGALSILCDQGLRYKWKGLNAVSDVKMRYPLIIAEQGKFSLSDTSALFNNHTEDYSLWKREDKENIRTSVSLLLKKGKPFIYYCDGAGAEMITAWVDADFQTDKPYRANEAAVSPQTLDSLYIKFVTSTANGVYVYDLDMAEEMSPSFNHLKRPDIYQFALQNAYLLTTPPAAILLTGFFSDDNQLIKGNLFITFGLFTLTPMLPHPYTSNVVLSESGFSAEKLKDVKDVKEWSRVLRNFAMSSCKWEEDGEADIDFELLTDLFNTLSGTPAADALQTQAVNAASSSQPNIVNEFAAIEKMGGIINLPGLSLLDLSTHYDLFGINMSWGQRGFRGAAAGIAAPVTEGTVTIEKMNLQSPMILLRAFTLPLVSWEPLNNLSKPAIQNDPPQGILSFPHNGVPTLFSFPDVTPVDIDPLTYLQHFRNKLSPANKQKGNIILSLPHGKFAMAILRYFDPAHATVKQNYDFIQPQFKQNSGQLKGGLQFRIASSTESGRHMLPGMTNQLKQIIDPDGVSKNISILGQSVHEIFLNDFFKNYQTNNPEIKIDGVPVTHTDISGYGSSMFSDWLNPSAQIAQTSEVRFDVMVGRVSHEVVQVVSIVYPWGIRVVRTITFHRNANSIIYREDSGWVAQSDGLFDFSFRGDTAQEKNKQFNNPYSFHPGLISGLYKVQNIRELEEEITIAYNRTPADYAFDTSLKQVKTNAPGSDKAIFSAVTFDADVLLEDVVSSKTNGRVTGRQFKGFVQISPPGVPVPPAVLSELFKRQQNAIGGIVDCIMAIGGSKQLLKVNRIDASASWQNNNTSDHIFVVAAKGSVQLPAEGSWSIVEVDKSKGEVSPVNNKESVPVIRKGERDRTKAAFGLIGNDKLVKVAFPDALVNNTGFVKRFAYLQNTGSQKLLLTDPKISQLLPSALKSEAPLLADAYRLLNSKGPFPNIADAITVENIAEAVTDILPDGLTKKILNFTVPDNLSFDIIGKDGDTLHMYVQYQSEPSSGKTRSVINYITDSIANPADKFKNELNNLSIAVDMGPFKKLLTVSGNFKAGSSIDPSMDSGNAPQLKLCKELQPIYDILEFLANLDPSNPVEAIKKGLKVAMSNNADSWEYKFKADKEIPLVKFPFDPVNYNSPTTPLKLDAYFRIGCYYNQPIKIPEAINQLTPSAGAFLELGADLRVMCVSLAAATIYATGRAQVGLAADIKSGPNLYFKFGFGIELCVGLPVVGSVSVMYLVGVDMKLTTQELTIGAFLYFRGRAEIFGGIVTVTIQIEAAGKIQKQLSGGPCNCQAICTFALDISIFLVINISFSETWEETRQIA